MTVNEILNFVNYIANKEQSGQTFTPQNFNLTLPRAQLDYITNSLQISPEKRDGRPILLVPNNLRVFKKTATLTLTNGLATVPDDYMYTTALGLLVTLTDNCGEPVQAEYPVEVVDDDEWTFRTSAALRKPTRRYPICKFHDTQIEFKPTGTYNLYYLRYPVTPVFGYTITNGVAVYNPSTSVQLELPDITHEEVCNILLRYIGINLSAEQLQQYAERSKQVV